MTGRAGADPADLAVAGQGHALCRDLLAMIDQPTGEQLAGRYFDEHIGPDDRKAGWPEDIIADARARYIRNACANPEAVRQLRAMYVDAPDKD